MITFSPAIILPTDLSSEIKKDAAAEERERFLRLADAIRADLLWRDRCCEGTYEEGFDAAVKQFALYLRLNLDCFPDKFFRSQFIKDRAP